MENRFQEMNEYFNRINGKSARSAGGMGGAVAGTAFAKSMAWARPFSASQRVLIVLIENGGIDLHIPDLVDKLVDAIPGSSLIPDSVRKDLRDYVAKNINDKVKSVTKDLLESAEMVINRYTAAKPGAYGDVVILRNSSATYSDLKTQLFAQTQAGRFVDLFILTHGGPNRISLNDGMTGAQISQMGKEFGKPLAIRSVYMMNCVGSSLNQAWLEIGARASSGTAGNNYLPEPTMYFVWQNWQAGQTFETAINSAYAQTVQLLNDVINGFFSALNIPGVGGLIDANNFDFVRDSKPVIAGKGGLTIATDDISFSQSTLSNGTATALPANLLRAMSDGGASTLTTSQNGIDLIKRFEAYKEKMYNDAAGHCTIGYGSKLHSGNCDGRANEQPYVNGVSEADATRMLQAELSTYEATIGSTAKVPLNQNQFDALASFVYNVGLSAFNKSTLAKLLRGGDYTGVPAEIKKWTKARVNGQLVDLKGLVKRRGEEAELFQKPVPAQSQSLSIGCYERSMASDKWDRIADSLFGYGSYDDFVKGALQSTTFLNRTINQVHADMVACLRTAEATLQGKGVTTAPTVDSTLRKRHSMHGWGMAIDFDVIENPYILNEAGEAELDKDLLKAYDHIANFILGLSSSSLRNLKKGRSAFGGTIAGVYDAMRAESDAMKRYFSMMNDAAALAAFISGGWATVHSGQSAPDVATVQAQMVDDYEILGGKGTSGSKRPTGKKGVDRPFAPASSGGRGDPATGFLNLDRDLVLALTDAGLAWGAVDMWGASGDVMHFDCRLTALGSKVFAALRAG